jgi:hypothetical protein
MHLRFLAAALLASMPSSLLLAQDAAPRPPEAGSRPESPDDSRNESRTESHTEVRIEREGAPGSRSVSLDMANGKPSRVVIDGEEIPLERLRPTPDGFEVLDAEGKVIERIAARMNRGAQRGARAGGDRAGQAAVFVEGRPLDAEALRELEMRRGEDADAPAPKSMIGAGLGSVSASIAHHLGLDAERASKATLLTGVVKDLPAAAAGLERFDVVVTVNGSDDASRSALGEVLRGAEPGSKVTLGVRRGGETKTVEVTVAAFDRAKLAAMEPIAAEGFEIDAIDLDAFEGFEIGAGRGLGGFAMPPMRMPRGAGVAADANMQIDDMRIEVDGDSAVGFFIGPDGERREFRMGVPGMPRSAPRGADAAQLDSLRDLMRELERRMESMNERLQGGPRMGDRPDAPRGERDGAQRTPRDEARRDEARRDASRADAETNERLRRLEERLDAVMRELERANAERRVR